MKSPLGLAKSKSTETLDMGASYEGIASEYYNERLHPTCADLRAASRLYLEKSLNEATPRGRIADVGCGQSLLLEFLSSNLVLVDSSESMLGRNDRRVERRLIDVEKESFGLNEFDWVFAVLADPFNTLETWRHIREAMVPGGSCVFILPSITWAERFRKDEKAEREGFAHFIKANGQSVYLRSLIFPEVIQKSLVEDSGLLVDQVHHVFVRDMTIIRSSKIFSYLSAQDAVLDVYRAVKIN